MASSSSRGGEDSLLVDSARLRRAVRAYLLWLAFHAAQGIDGGTVLVRRAPPLDLAWIWHVHRLAPRAYADRMGHVNVVKMLDEAIDGAARRPRGGRRESRAAYEESDEDD